MSLLSAVAPVDDTPVDRYLSRQADLSAVERFSQRHEAELVPRQARYYRDLIPLDRPQPGQQYGFEVDLDACSGCKACVSACHSLNGLDADESWRTVTVVRGGPTERPFQQTVTAACHHCVDPACMKGCPVDAYEKDPVTGIVIHLDDQCIGCSYCTLSCPYEVPRLNRQRGIVRKCDMCQGRLAAGEAPACVQACPNGAISIAIVDMADMTSAATTGGGSLVPGGPPSSITVPTTVYRTATGRIYARPTAQSPSTGPAHAHPPLAVMLVLTQLSVGAFVIDLVLRSVGAASGGAARATVDAALAVAAGVVALAASVFHLGRPRYCYRAVIGLRHSWLSREVVAFGAFTSMATLYSFGLVRGRLIGPRLLAGVGAMAAIWGVAGVACSVLIYATTHRSSWRVHVVAAKFTSTMAMCGSAAVAWASIVSGRPASGRPLLLALAGMTAAKLTSEASVFRHLRSGGGGDGRRRARLLRRDLRTTARCRYGLGIAGGLLMPLAAVASITAAGRSNPLNVVLATAVLAATVGGELAERSIFFTTASPPR